MPPGLSSGEESAFPVFGIVLAGRSVLVIVPQTSKPVGALVIVYLVPALKGSTC
jgi:hypothetical protein